MTALYLNVISGGILIGVVYALIALGLTIIFGVMRVVNFAHGEMVVIGMYIGYGLWSAFKLPPWMLAPVAAALLFALGYALQLGIVNALPELRAILLHPSTGRSTHNSFCSFPLL